MCNVCEIIDVYFVKKKRNNLYIAKIHVIFIRRSVYIVLVNKYIFNRKKKNV